MNFNPQNNHRILVIDDDPDTHDLIRKMLFRSTAIREKKQGSPELIETPPKMPLFEIDSAYQGQEGLVLIEESLRQNRPYSLAFVDVRMPPGWDGLETIRKIWEKYSALQVVICTAHHDHSWEEMVKNLGYLDRVVILNKPFDRIEISQLAVALTKKWRLNQQVELRVDNLEKLVQRQHLG
jgi:CheY-like chemotaxis protein